MAKKSKYQSRVFRAKGVRLVFDSKEWRKMLTSEEVTADLLGRGEAIAAAADAASGGTHVVRSEGRGARGRRGRIARRSRVAVVTADGKAVVGEARDHTLLRALGAGRADPPGNPPPPGPAGG